MEEIDQQEIQLFEDIEEEQHEDGVKLMEKPFDPTKINVETKTPSLDTLIKRIKRGNVALDTESYFQRKSDLWDKGKQSRLIESILIRFPLPAFFFDASDDNRWLIVDGLQRLSTIRNFVVNKTLRLQELEFLTHLEGKTWDELPGDLQRVIEESQTVIYKIMPGTPTDVKFNIFKRINTGGLVLEPQEIRHALFQGTPAKFVQKLAESDAFLRATDRKIRTDRMLDRDFVNRFIAFYLLLETEGYQPDLDVFMSKGMARLDWSTTDLGRIERDFTKAMDLSHKIFGREAFRKIKGPYHRLPPINKALFDAVATQFALLSSEACEKLYEKGQAFKASLQAQIDQDYSFFLSLSSATGDKGRVMKRHETIKKLINQAIA